MHEHRLQGLCGGGRGPVRAAAGARAVARASESEIPPSAPLRARDEARAEQAASQVTWDNTHRLVDGRSGVMGVKTVRFVAAVLRASPGQSRVFAAGRYSPRGAVPLYLRGQARGQGGDCDPGVPHDGLAVHGHDEAVPVALEVRGPARTADALCWRRLRTVPLMLLCVRVRVGGAGRLSARRSRKASDVDQRGVARANIHT